MAEARCQDCSWSESGTLIMVSDEAEDHEQKEVGHTVKVKRTATDGGQDLDHVLVRPATSMKRDGVYHLPDPNDPDRPVCGHTLRTHSSYRRKDLATLREDKYDLCAYCDEDNDAPWGGAEGEQMAAKLEQMDPDDLATDGGGIPLAGGRSPDDEDDEWYVVDEDRAAVVDGPHSSQDSAVEAAADREPGHVVMTKAALELLATTSSRTIRWETEDDDVDVITDGGRYQCPVCAHPYDREKYDHCPSCTNSGLDEYVTDGGQPIGPSGGATHPNPDGSGTVLPEHLTTLSKLGSDSGTLLRCMTCGATAEDRDDLDHHDDCPEVETATDSGGVDDAS